jgi:hypothetical protein
MKKNILFIGLISLGINAKDSFEFKKTSMEKGDWVSKMVLENGFSLDKSLNPTMKRNNLTFEQAKKMPIGSIVEIPFRSINELASSDEAIEQNVNLVDSAIANDANENDNENDTQSEGEVSQTQQLTRAIFGNVDFGVFYEDQDTTNYTADLNVNYYLGLTLGHEFFKSNQFIPSIGMKLWGKFYDSANLPATNSDVRLDPSFGIDLLTSARFDTIGLTITPLVTLEQSNYFYEAANNTFGARKDNNAWIGLGTNKRIGKFNLFASAKHLLANDRRSSAEGLERLEGQKYGAGVQFNLYNFLTSVYHDYSDFKTAGIEKSKVYGVNLGYKF